MPAYPVRDAPLAVVAQRVLRLAEQVVIRLRDIGCGPAGIAQREMLRQWDGLNHRRGWGWCNSLLLAGGKQQSSGNEGGSKAHGQKNNY